MNDFVRIGGYIFPRKDIKMIRSGYNESMKCSTIEVHMQEELYIVKDLMDDDECKEYLIKIFDHLCE